MKKRVLLFALILVGSFPLLVGCGEAISSVSGVMPEFSTVVDPFVGVWAWTQIARNINKNNTSVSLGYVEIRPDGTCRVRYVDKVNNDVCYHTGEYEAIWRKFSVGVYRLRYGNYYYDVLISGNVGSFALMSVADSNDAGGFEVGNLYRGLNINFLLNYYENRRCR